MEASEKPDIADVLEYYGADLSRVPPGSGWAKIHCPFHDDTQPSASVNLATGHFKCFRCAGFYGDSIKIICEAEGLGFRDALQWAEANLGFDRGEVREATRERYRPSWEEESD